MWKWLCHFVVHTHICSLTPQPAKFYPQFLDADTQNRSVVCDTFSGGYRKSIKSEYRENGDVVVSSDHQSMNHTIYVITRSFNPCSSFKRDLHFTLLPLPYKMSIECNDNYQNFLSFSFHPLLKRQPGTFNSGDYLNSIVVYLDLNW